MFKVISFINSDMTELELRIKIPVNMFEALDVLGEKTTEEITLALLKFALAELEKPKENRNG